MSQYRLLRLPSDRYQKMSPKQNNFQKKIFNRTCSIICNTKSTKKIPNSKALDFISILHTSKKEKGALTALDD